MVWAQDPPSPPAQPPVAQPATPAQPPAAAPTQAPVKTVSFMFEDKPWSQVLDWFAKESDLVLITTIKPTGSVTIKTDPGRKYTIPEVVDVLNEALAQQKYVLIRRSRSFSIWPADEKLDPSLVQRITLDEIKDKGDTEIVSVTVPLKTLNADDIVPYVQKLKGTFGEVNPFGSNSIILQDTAKNIRRIVHDLAALEDEKQAGDSLTYTCKFVRASLAAESLSKLLSDQTTQVQNAAMMQQPYGGYPYGGGYPQQSDGRSSRDRSSSSTTGMAGRFKTVNIAVVEATNTIMITGPADKIAAATKFLKDLDQGQEGDKVRIIGPAEIRTYAVPAGSSETVAKTLTDVYKSSTVIRVTALPNRNEIMVYAPPADHFDIVRQLQGTKEVTSSTVTEVIPLASFKNPQEVVDQLKRLFPDTTGSGAILEPRTEPTPAVIVKGTQQQIADIKAALGAVEGVSGGIGGDDSRIRIVPIAGGNSAAAAEKLAELIRQMGNNPVELRGVEPKMPKPAPAPAPAPGSNFDSRRLPKTGPDYVVAQIADPQAKPPAPQPEPGKKPVVITVTGNSIIITSEDPVALNTVTQLARVLTSDKPEDGLYKVIRLKNAPAEQAAQVINEIFNGPAVPVQPQQGGGRGGRGGGGISGALGFLTQFAGIGASAPSDPAAGRVRVVAEKQSNSLIVVKASQLDLFTIERLLEKAIDNNDVESDVVMKSRIIPLQYAEATEVASVLRDVFSNLTTVPGSSGGRGGRGGNQFPFPFPIPGQAGGATAQQPQLTIGTLEQTNSIVINCNEAVFKEVSALVKALDQDAETQTEIVKVVQVQGIDPALIQQAIDAIAGRQPTPLGTSSPFGSGFGGSGFGGFGGTNRGNTGRGGFGFPGMTGGTRGGGSNRGSGRSNRGGNNRRSSLDPGSGGRDFFEYRDMDVPSDNASLIFDPENPEHLANYQPVAYQIPSIPNPDGLPQPGQQPDRRQPDDQPRPGQQPGAIEAPAPSPETSVQALQELGLLILRARNPQEMEELLRFIDFIQKGSKAEIKLQLVELENGDATQIVNLLNTIYSRVNIQGATTTVIPGQGQAGGLGGLLRGFGGGQTAQAQSVGSVYFLALPRFNKILFAAPEARVEDVMDKIKLLDKPSSEQMKPARFPLKRASAQIVANQILNFFNNRYSPETAQTNQIRVTFDISTNTVIVQAGPADMKDIAELIEALDNSTSNAVNELRVFKLNNAFADEIAQTLITAVTAGLSNPALAAQATGLPLGVGGGGASPFATGGFGGAGAGGPGGGLGGGLGGLGGGLGGIGGAAGGLGGRGGAGGAFNTLNGGGLLTKTSSLRFYGSNGSPIESGFLEDVQIIPDNRINGVVVSAPEKTMRLLEKLIEELDTPSAARSDVKVFTLKRSDAQATLNLISQLFASSTGAGGAGGGFGGQFGGQAGGQGGVGPIGGNRPILTLTGAVAPGTTVVGLRASVDTRTNSLIVAGSPTDLETIRAIVARLEDAEAPQLISKVYKLRHAGAADVQTAVLTFLQNKLQAEQTQFTTTFQTFQRNVFIQAEPISNTLLIAASPEYFEEVIRLIEKVDAMPPQVFVQVLIAEVQLRNTEEFGVEVGLQSPVLFARSQVGTSPGTPGFNFNTTAALPNTNAADPGVVGFQGLGNLGVGRSGSTGVGGFVFSAGSEAFTLLIRALKSQGRVDVLSHPQLLLLDNQTGFFQVGQSFPIPTGLSQGVGQTLQGIEYREIGITLRVTPRINPDGKVLMRIEPQISNPSPTLINLGNGQFATAFDQQTVQTTVLASDGETIVLGGLIRRSDSKNENKIPLLGDIPYLGAAFRYRTQNQERRELVFIVTPHLITSESDIARITAEEARKMSWSLRDVAEVHSWGTPVLAGKTPEGMDPQYCPPGSPGSMLPGYGSSMTPANPGYPPATGVLPGGIQPDGPNPIIPDGTIIPQQPGMSGQPLPFPQGSPMSNGYRHESLPAGIVPDRTAQPAVNATASPGIFGATPGQPATVAPAGWVPPPPAAPIVSQPAGQAPMNAPPPGWTYTGQPGPVQTPAATLRQHLANQQAEQQAKAEAEAKAKEQSTRTSNPGAKEAKKWNVFGR